jgi:myosin heavy subunit
MVLGKAFRKKVSPVIVPSSLGEGGGSEVTTNPDGSTVDVDDKTLLTVMDKDHILANMRNRFHRDCIYTYTASVLLSVNPWKTIPKMYTAEMQILYTNRSMHSLPPHPFAIADTAYRYFQGDSRSQALVISGESGSGKTETAKTVISFLASHKERRKAKIGSDSPVSDVEAIASSIVHDRVIFATPILEAFGNASTIRNKNSSRFGKYHRLLYDKSGRLCGADIKPFLLESSRVTSISSHERNFHIFYQLLAGLSDDDLASKFKLSKSGRYPLVANGMRQDSTHVKEDAEKFEESQSTYLRTQLGKRSKKNEKGETELHLAVMNVIIFFTKWFIIFKLKILVFI